MSEQRSFYETAGRQPSTDEILAEQSVVLERKTFVISLRQNARGRFLRITESFHGGRDCIIVPGEGLDEFAQLVEVMVKAAFEMPAQ